MQGQEAAQQEMEQQAGAAREQAAQGASAGPQGQGVSAAAEDREAAAEQMRRTEANPFRSLGMPCRTRQPMASLRMVHGNILLARSLGRIQQPGSSEHVQRDTQTMELMLRLKFLDCIMPLSVRQMHGRHHISCMYAVPVRSAVSSAIRVSAHAAC